ncbi:MAG: hypothetical protein R6V62_06745 [Candidatus Fermentibacteraceae bacterium]
MLKTHGSFLFVLVVTAAVVGTAAGFGLPDISDVTGIELPKEATRVTLLPSQVHAAFSSLDEPNPFEPVSLTYLHTDMRDYDDFFFRASRMRGTIQLAHRTVEMLQTITDTEMLAKALGDEEFLNSIEDSEQFETYETLKLFIPASIDGLTALPQTVTQLVSTSANLVTSAPSDFAGVNAVHLPMILTELASTAELLGGLPGEAALLLSELQAAIPTL